jgi:hypothetical protein
MVGILFVWNFCTTLTRRIIKALGGMNNCFAQPSIRGLSLAEKHR